MRDTKKCAQQSISTKKNEAAVVTQSTSSRIAGRAFSKVEYAKDTPVRLTGGPCPAPNSVS